jgi:hypothetical protein
MPAETIITATLIRGKKYSYNQILKQDEVGNATETKFWAFERGIPVPVSSGLADELEELCEIDTTRDGDEIEKPRFKIDRNAPRQSAKVLDPNKKVRMRLVRADEAPRPPAVRPKPAPSNRGLYGRKIGG